MLPAAVFQLSTVVSLPSTARMLLSKTGAGKNSVTRIKAI